MLNVTPSASKLTWKAKLKTKPKPKTAFKAKREIYLQSRTKIKLKNRTWILKFEKMGVTKSRPLLENACYE